MSRFAALVSLAAAAAVLAGCAPGRNDELKELVETVAPAQKELVGCGWESNWGNATDVKSFYGCSWVVRGTIASVGRPLVSRAVATGFTVYCDGAENEFQVQGARGNRGLVIELLGRAAARTREISFENSDFPPGHLLVSIGAAEFKSGAPHGSTDQRCVA